MELRDMREGKEDVSAIYVSMPRWLRLLSGKTLKRNLSPFPGQAGRSRDVRLFRPERCVTADNLPVVLT